jgi:cytochrome P450
MSEATVEGLVIDTPEEEINADLFGFLASLRARTDVAFVKAVNAWVVVSWEGVQAVLNGGDAFRSRPTYLIRPSFGGEMISTVPDGPLHQAHRKGFDSALAPRPIEGWADDVIPPLVNERLDAIVADGRGDLLDLVIGPASLDVLAYAVGIPDVPQELRWKWYLGIADGETNFNADPGRQNRSWALSDEIDTFFRPLMREKWDNPDDTLMSTLLQNAFGESFGERFAFAMPDVKVALFAGSQEPAHAAVNGIIGLLSHEDARNRFAADPWGLAEQATEEGLRWFPPLTAFMRKAAMPAEIAGVAIPKDDFLLVSVLSANRDTAIWGDSGDIFDIDRFAPDSGAPRHITFGKHPHFCVGNYLVRATMRRALPAIFERLPNLRLDPERHSLEGCSLLINAPHLHCLWDPS